MRENVKVAVKYGSYEAVTVGIDPTDKTGSVENLVSSFQALPNSPLASTFIGSITLHYRSTASGSLLHLPKDLLLAELFSRPDFINNFSNPLILKVKSGGSLLSALTESVSNWLFAPPSNAQSVLDLRSAESILGFIEGEMKNCGVLNSRKHIIGQRKRGFKLVGRGKTIDKAVECFSSIVTNWGQRASDRTDYPIPVCAGLSGLGKTRMLEEGDYLLERIGITGSNMASVIVPYFNGYSIVQREHDMGIEASFSWRLLHRMFIDSNGLAMKLWFDQRLPQNANDLKFEIALEVIYLKLKKLGVVGEEGEFYLFLGVDEYQKIRNIKGDATSPLHKLIDCIGNYMCNVNETVKIILLPMLAGTDWNALRGESIVNSSYYATKRLPMSLLTTAEVRDLITGNPETENFLSYALVNQHLFFLGGVPRWTTDYLLSLKPDSSGSLDISTMESAFKSVRPSYELSFSQLEKQDLIKLAAYSLTGLNVDPDGMFNDKYKWATLRDSSLCIIGDDLRLQVPYTIFVSICEKGSVSGDSYPKHIEYFIQCVEKLHEDIDKNTFTLQPWQLWEKFGALFYALRINAFMVIGKQSISLCKLFNGALISEDIKDLCVQLVPTRVLETRETLSENIPAKIGMSRNAQQRIDWIAPGYIVVNGDSGKGADIFFILNQVDFESKVFVVDQRKRANGLYSLTQARKHLDSATIVPKVLGKDVQTIRGVMNCISDASFALEDLPSSSFVVSRAQSEIFHGSLFLHPACSPLISVNLANKTALKMVFTGGDTDQLVNEMIRKRRDPDSFSFSDEKELRDYIKKQKLDIEIAPESQPYIDFLM